MPPPFEPDLSDRMRGLLLGTAVGDALGLPAEGISRRRSHKLFKGRWRHHFFFGRGMISDDTEHAIFVAQALLASPGSPERFVRRLAWSLRAWLLALPAGIGLATLKSILRLWLGFPPSRSGVFSAGNGPAMRAAPIGAFHAFRPGLMRDCLQASTRLTHTDPRALTGALAVATLASWLIQNDPAVTPGWAVIEPLLDPAADPEWQEIVGRMRDALALRASVATFAAQLGQARGISGYIYHTVPVAIYAWFRHYGNFENTMEAVLNCGGDTDTAGAIAGALAGLTVGERGIPADWLAGIRDWPRGVPLLRRLAGQMTEALQGRPARPVSCCWPAVPLRNLVFLVIVLWHGFRRLAPPY